MLGCSIDRWASIVRALAGCATVAGIVGCLAATEPSLHDQAAAVVEEYMEQASGSSTDRGWDLLMPETQATTFGGDFEGYISQVSTDDWTAFDWRVSDVERDEPFTYDVWIVTRGPVPSTIARLASAEGSHGPVFSVRFVDSMSGGIWMIDGFDERLLPPDPVQ